MNEASPARLSKIKPTRVLAFAAAVLAGIAIGVIATKLWLAQVPSEQRWFVWEGSAPLSGASFSSLSLCQTARETLVADAERKAYFADKDEMNALKEEEKRVRRAYCHRDDNR